MDLNDLKKNWDQFGKKDPYWAIITQPDKKGNKWKEEEFFETGIIRMEKVKNQIKQIKSNFSFHSALDFGCGAGRITQAMANYFEHVAGVDIAPSMIQLAKEKNTKDNCRYYLNEKNDLALFEKESFDFVFTMITLQHMQPKYAKNYIAEFLRVLKPGGLIIFQIPSKPDIWGRLYHHFTKIEKLLGIDLNKSLMGKNQDAVMEMYWIEIDELKQFITQKGGIIHKTIEDSSAGESWESYTYVVSK